MDRSYRNCLILGFKVAFAKEAFLAMITWHLPLEYVCMGVTHQISLAVPICPADSPKPIQFGGHVELIWPADSAQ